MYRAVLEGDVYEVSSPAVAEMEKILENTYRNINIGLVNELAILCDRNGYQYVGSYRCCENKAIWIPGILSRPGPWRALHSAWIRITFQLESKRIWIPHFYDRIVHDDQ